MTEIIVAEEHSQLYDLWLERGCRDLAVCHVDFHCDMRGLLIDRGRGRARFIGRHVPFIHRLDSGSYLSHAVMNGMVSKLRWVHDEFGGREYDYLHCVKYQTDFSALGCRITGRGGCVPLDYQEQTFTDWSGPRPGEHLDLDWDGIAHADYDLARIRRLMTEILRRDYRPESIFLARSPQYCHPERALFEEFVAALERKFRTKARRLPPAVADLAAPSPFWSLYRRVDRFVVKRMHRAGLLFG